MYRELVVIVARDVAEVLSDALLELGALSVQAEDADGGLVAHHHGLGEIGKAQAYSAIAGAGRGTGPEFPFNA